ncbi:ArsR/SmtB family transcription factor [Mesorhizobium xinjiangense]|uniref:ArsR/SmtB family transcription factor n=1 Tax=Mesorhizobium xinjiangense TaxID=2678685 RepID=UPI002E2743CD
MPEADTLETAPDDALAAQLAALGHPARICILRHLARQDACCCREIVDCIDLAQSTVSQHLKVLVAAGLVRYEPENRKSRYSLERGAVLRLSAGVGDLLATCCARR